MPHKQTQTDYMYAFTMNSLSGFPLRLLGMEPEAQLEVGGGERPNSIPQLFSLCSFRLDRQQDVEEN